MCSISFQKSFLLFFGLEFVVVLLDTTKEATLEWTRYPYGPQAQTPGVSFVHTLTQLLSNSISSYIYLRSGSKNRSRISAKESIGVVMWCVMLRITMWTIGSGHRSSIEVQPIVSTSKSNSRFVTVHCFRAMHCHAKRHSVCCSTNLMRPHVNHRHGNRKVIN